MTPEQIAKLRSELDVVQTNGQVLGEMLITLQPGEEHPQDLEFLIVKNLFSKTFFHLISFKRNYIKHVNKCKLVLLIYLLKYQLMT